MKNRLDVLLRRDQVAGFGVRSGGTALALCICVLIGGLSGCFGVLKDREQQAFNLATALHRKMTAGDLAGIYTSADDRYRAAVTREKSDALFSAIARKLGPPLDCTQGRTNYQVNTSGTTLVFVCQTKFTKDATAVETFKWIKSGDQFKLLGYNIQSEELIER
jgi:hypothetical protein